MARDIIISSFATSRTWQPVSEFEDAPLVIGVEGIGSDSYMASFDTAKGPREPWGGKPFSREIERFKNIGSGSILQGILKDRAAGVEPRRICAVAFSAGNTFLSGLLKSDADASLLDTVLSLDGMTYQIGYGGKVLDFDHWLRFGKRACGLDRMSATGNPYLGPLMVVSHTHIVSAAPTQVSSTNAAAEYLFAQINPPYWAAANALPKSVLDAEGVKQQQVQDRLRAAMSQIPLPLKINGGNPPTTKTWASMPWPTTVSYLGNLWSLDWGGQQGPDHIFEAQQIQQALWRSYLIPRWNAREQNVAGLGGLGLGLGAETMQEGAVTWTTPIAKPGGGLLLPGTLNTGVSWWKLGLTAVGGFAAGAVAIGKLSR